MKKITANDFIAIILTYGFGTLIVQDVLRYIKLEVFYIEIYEIFSLLFLMFFVFFIYKYRKYSFVKLFQLPMVSVLIFFDDIMRFMITFYGLKSNNYYSFAYIIYFICFVLMISLFGSITDSFNKGMKDES